MGSYTFDEWMPPKLNKNDGGISLQSVGTETIAGTFVTIAVEWTEAGFTSGGSIWSGGTYLGFPVDALTDDINNAIKVWIAALPAGVGPVTKMDFLVYYAQVHVPPCVFFA